MLCIKYDNSLVFPAVSPLLGSQERACSVPACLGESREEGGKQRGAHFTIHIASQTISCPFQSLNIITIFCQHSTCRERVATRDVV